MRAKALHKMAAQALVPVVEVLMEDEVRVGDRIYPGWYIGSVGRFRPDPRDVERMREALSAAPSVRGSAKDYDILFNAETREWVVVKWVEETEPIGMLPEGIFLTETVRRPLEIMEWSALERPTALLGARDFQAILAHATTITGRKKQNTDLRKTNDARIRANHKREEDAEHDFLGYYHKQIREIGERTGMAYATPEEMAAKFGGRPEDWHPDHIPGME